MRLKAFCTSLLLLFIFNSTPKADTPSIKPIPETWQQEMLLLVNQIRSKGCRCGHKRMRPAGALRLNQALNQVAQKHADDMDYHRFLGHYGSNGSRIGQRVTAMGYDWQRVAENVAWNFRSVQEAVEGWRDSPGHCVNLMGNYTEIGLARSGDHWVQVFATPMR